MFVFVYLDPVEINSDEYQNIEMVPDTATISPEESSAALTATTEELNTSRQWTMSFDVNLMLIGDLFSSDGEPTSTRFFTHSSGGGFFLPSVK